MSANAAWPAAKIEWRLHRIDSAPAEAHCACGHALGAKVCVFENTTGKTAIVGSTCAKKHLGVDPSRILAAIEVIRRDPLKPASALLIDFADALGITTRWESRILRGTRRRASMTARQLEKRQELSEGGRSSLSPKRRPIGARGGTGAAPAR
ncbi:MAG: hypothetical protein HYV07_16200 [Deltaproteobacteria bacterium]|nr:hypothetical protein [Deltaproteobacteria bacterium]